MSVIVVSLFGVILAVAADYFLKMGRPWVGASLYAGCAWPAFWCFRHAQFGYVTIIWAATLVVVGVLVGRFIFHESLTPMRVMGLTAAVAAIVLAR